MSDCGCEKARADLEAFVRGELDYCQTAQAEIRDHIETCPGCQNEATVARTMTIAIQRACLDEAAPDIERLVSSGSLIPPRRAGAWRAPRPVTVWSGVRIDRALRELRG